MADRITFQSSVPLEVSFLDPDQSLSMYSFTLVTEMNCDSYESFHKFHRSLRKDIAESVNGSVVFTEGDAESSYVSSKYRTTAIKLAQRPDPYQLARWLAKFVSRAASSAEGIYKDYFGVHLSNLHGETVSTVLVDEE